MTSPDSFSDSTRFDEESAFEPTMVPWAPTLDDIFSLGSLGSVICDPRAGSNSMVTNQTKEDPYSSLASTSSFDPIGSVATVATLDPTPDQIAWFPPDTENGLGPILNVGPEIVNALQTNDEISWRSSSSSIDVSCPRNLDPEILSFVRQVEDSFQTKITAFDAIPPVDGWDITQQAGFPSENPPIFDFVVPAVGITDPSFPSKNTQAADLGIAQSPPYIPNPSVEQLIISMEPVRACQWKDVDGTLCGDLVTLGSLPEHLSKHGIKNRTRDHPTKCHWVGCKRKRHMNRESIVRHIREVHLRMRRTSKRARAAS